MALTVGQLRTALAHFDGSTPVRVGCVDETGWRDALVAYKVDMLNGVVHFTISAGRQDDGAESDG